MRLTSPMPATTLTFALLRSTTSRPASRTQHRIQSMGGRSYGQPTRQGLRGILSTHRETFRNALKQSPTMLIGLIGGSMWVSMIAQKREAQFEMGQRVAHRMGRSGSRSGNVVERARLFERAAAETRGNSGLWTCQSPGGVAGGHGSPSGNRGQVEEMWMN